ncbi:MAG: calcium-binding protein [Pseudomonadota bacterium]
MSTVNGSSGDDFLQGDASNDDVIYGGSGNDNIESRGGSDTVYGGSGNDFILGYDGSNAAGGSTVVASDDGSDDTLYGGGGNDTLAGGEGNDTLYGGADYDILYGGGGDDHIYTGSSFNDAYGGSGNDSINGNSDGSEFIYGGADDDTLTGGGGNGDRLYGGTGADIFVINDGDGADTIGDFNLGEGDVIDVSGLTTNGSTPIETSDIAVGNDGSGNAVLSFPDGTSVTLRGISQSFATSNLEAMVVTANENGPVFGTDSNDSNISGSGGGQEIYGGADSDGIGTGDDTITSGGSGDTIYAGDGDDLIEVDDDGTIYGGSGDDVFDTQANDNRNTLYGGDDDDTFNIGLGNRQTVFGGEGGTDNDTLTALAADDAVTLTFTGEGQGTFADDDGDEGAFAEIETFELTNRADSIDGTASSEDVTVLANAGQDTISLGGGADSIDGGADGDTLSGGAGDDRIDGGSASDVIYGGDDADTIVVTSVDDAEVIFGGEGGTDNDTLDLSALGAGVTVNFTTTEDGTFTDGSNTVSFFGIENVISSGTVNRAPITDLSDGSDNGTVTGSSAGDEIYGGVSTSETDGGAFADDTISADAGDDTVYGGEGQDTIDAQDGNDIVYGGDDADSITAGSGDDVVDGGTGGDRIAGDAGSDTISGNNGADSIDGGSDDDSITGDGGADQIAGGTGSDSISGGSGNDLILGGEDESGGTSEQLSGFTFQVANVSSTGTGSGPGDIGDFIVYDNVGVTDQGTTVQARITVMDLSNDALTVDFGVSDSVPVQLNASGAGNAGDSADIRIEFFDQATGQVIKLDSSFTFQDIDTSSESVTIGKDDARSVSLSNDPPTDLAVTDNGDSFTISDASNTSSGNSDEDHWATVSFEDQSVMSFGLTSRGGGTNYGFATQEFTNPPTVITVTSTDDDTLAGDSGTDTIYGGLGQDSIDGGTDGDTLYGGEDADTVSGGEGADTLFGDAGADTVYGGDGDDQINGGADADTLYGGDDRDSFVFEDGFGADTVFGGEGGTDSDTLDLSNLSVGVDVEFLGDERGDFTDGTDTATFREIETIILTDHDDDVDALSADTALNIYAGDGNDTLIGGDFEDTLYGGAGDDGLFGGLGGSNGILYGGTGNDRLGTGSSTEDTLYGGDDDDSLMGGVGNDVLYGGNDDDTLTGFGGFSHIDGGDDVLYGGDGSDLFEVEATFGTDTIYGGEGGTDSDTLDLSALDTGVTVTYTGDEQGTFTDGTDTGTFFGIENVILTDQNDVFDASLAEGDVSVDGGAGDDTLQGNTGDDTTSSTLVGGTGADTFLRTDGSNTLYGGDDGHPYGR